MRGLENPLDSGFCRSGSPGMTPLPTRLSLGPIKRKNWINHHSVFTLVNCPKSLRASAPLRLVLV
jgi:hypothetical protein